VTIDNTWLDSRIEKTKAMIAAYEDAILAVSAGQVQSYTLNTGQTTQSVTKSNLDGLKRGLDSLYALLDTLCARRYGSGTIIGAPSW